MSISRRKLLGFAIPSSLLSLFYSEKNSAAEIKSPQENSLDRSHVNETDLNNKTVGLVKDEVIHDISSSNGAQLLGWKRKVSKSDSGNVGVALDGSVVNIWEFADFVTDRPGDDPSLWDWSPATRAAIEYCTEYRRVYGSEVRFQTISLRYPGGYYMHKTPIECANRAKDGSTTFATTLKISGDGKTGTTLASAISGLPLFFFTGLRVCIEDIAFTRHLETENVQFIKLGDENAFTPCSHSTFRNIVMSNATKSFIIGQLFDSTFQSIHIIGARPSGDIQPTMIEILPHNSDSTNQLTFLNIVLETAYSENTVMFKSVAKSIKTPHHSIHWFGGHFETNTRGVLSVDLTNTAFCSFTGVNFVSNGKGKRDSVKRTVNVNNCTRIDFRSCYFYYDYKVYLYDSNSDESVIHVVNSCNNIFIDSSFFVTPYKNTLDKANWKCIINCDDAAYKERSFRFLNCAFNDFKSIGSSTIGYYSSINNSGEVWSTYVDDASSFSLAYSNSNHPEDISEKLFDFTKDGFLNISQSNGGLKANGNLILDAGRVSVSKSDLYVSGDLVAKSVTQLSDSRLKSDVREINSKVIEVAKSVSPKQFFYKTDADKVIHFGFIAQELIEAFEYAGLNAFDYGLVFRKDAGKDFSPLSETDEFFSINYSELMLLRSL
ncbi:tail fiber domain-containing protein [Pantoea coffeiphila]|uniref:tail fiber domain-containing protein n=1 Tax=Pantoea coffeiphila TaxID=1465635 RepID=UPI0019618ACD|nr:tail fiber domain-containing protein [Pantoea coffeiphila]MBM7343807.1 hypothetical protein [Pantoea coffeiphila]